MMRRCSSVGSQVTSHFYRKTEIGAWPAEFAGEYRIPPHRYFVRESAGCVAFVE